MRKMEAQKMENPREETQTRPQETAQETHGITKQSMEEEAKNEEAFQRIMPSAETGNPGRVGE